VSPTTASETEGVRRANLAFYRAFERLEAEKMREIWLHSARVQCTHPGWRRLVGYAAVMDSWERIFENTFEMSFDLTNVEISVAGALAWVEATNLFERHGGEWRMVHHHGSPVVLGPGSEEPSPHLQ
jgi:ketosteroid isomerase-like protein